MTPDESLDHKTMRMLERALDAGLAASPDDHELLRIGYDAASMLLNNRIVAPGRGFDHIDADESLGASADTTYAALRAHPLTLALGARYAEHAGLADELQKLRRAIVEELGVITPVMRVRRNPELADDVFELRINGDLVTTQSAVDPDALTTLVGDALRRNLHELLSREEVAELLNIARVETPMVVQELIPNMLALGQLRQVLQHLVREGVSIRNLSVILNALADSAVYTKDPNALTEHVRAALGRRIRAAHESADGALNVIQLHPDTERVIQNAIALNETGQVLALDPSTAAAIGRSFAKIRIPDAVVVAPSKLRRHVRTLLLATDPAVVVLGAGELESGSRTNVIGTIDAGDLARPLPTASDAPPSGNDGDVGSMRW